MRVTHTVAHARHAAPAFAVLTDNEILTLRQLPAWMRWLYMELVAMSDFKAGRVRTSYAQLAALLGYDQAERGVRLPTPTLKQIRTGLEQLAGVGLALRDKRANERAGELQILVPPREGFGTSTAKQGRVSGRGSTPQKADQQRPKPARSSDFGQGFGQVVQERNSLLPPPLHEGKLSTGDGRKRAMDLSDELARERGKKRAPQGADHSPLRGTPPVVPAMQQLGDVLPGGGHQEGPPGGQSPAPAGHAPDRAGRFVGPPLPLHARGVDMRDPINWQRDASGALIPPVGMGPLYRTSSAPRRLTGLDDAGPGISGGDRYREPTPSTAPRRGGPKSGDG